MSKHCLDESRQRSAWEKKIMVKEIINCDLPIWIFRKYTERYKLSKTKMEVEFWQTMADGLENSAFKAGPSRIPRVPFPAKVETRILIKTDKLSLSL